MTTAASIGLVDARQSPMSAADGQALATALNHQLHYHVAPACGIRPMPVQWYGPVAPASQAVWQVVILDEPDVPNALGYHDVAPNGVPYGRVFAHPTAQAGVSLSSVISHEVVEAAGDPPANRWADDGHGRAVAFELGDPVQSSAYMVSGIQVSNFVTAAWFDPGSPGPFDFLRRTPAPFRLDAGGYLIQMRDGAVSQQFGEDYPLWREGLIRTPEPSRTVWREVRLLAP